MSRTLDPEKKFEAVLEVLSRREALSVIARRYGMSEQSLRNAKEEFISNGKEALYGRNNRKHKKEVAQLKKQLKECNLVIGEYAIANRILKKKVDGYL